MSKIRCKFRCNSIKETLMGVQNPETKAYESKTIYSAEMLVVTGDSEENKKFFLWTPSGKLEVGLHQDKVFEVGKEYYVDITPAT